MRFAGSLGVVVEGGQVVCILFIYGRVSLVVELLGKAED